MRRINQFLNPRLVEICERTEQIQVLNNTLGLYLPVSLQPHCHVGSFNGGCLIIIANDAVWAAELRYHLPELRDRLRKEAGVYQLTSIKISISAPEIPLEKNHNKVSSLSSKARESIKGCEENCSYTPLKEALHRLARE